MNGVTAFNILKQSPSRIRHHQAVPRLSSNTGRSEASRSQLRLSHLVEDLHLKEESRIPITIFIAAGAVRQLAALLVPFLSTRTKADYLPPFAMIV